jgi:GT2 family glycosyltransferase
MTETNAQKVAIIVLNWNGISDTLTLLQDLEQVTYPNFSVLVVDNASTDDSLGQLARYMEQRRQRRQTYSLSLLPLSKNFGFSEGNNKGVYQAARERPDYYLFLNNDTLVDPGFLTTLVTAAELESTIGAVAPTMYFATPEGKKSDDVWYAGGWLNFFAGGAHHRVELPSKPWPSVVPNQFLTGCCFLIKREALVKVTQAFDPAFFAYGEDVDLSLRLTNAGYTLGYVPKATIWHKLATSSGGPKSYNFWYYNVRNNFIVMARYARWYHWPVFLCYFLLYKPVLLSVAGAILRPRRDKWYRLLAIAHGTIDAIRGRTGRRK